MYTNFKFLNLPQNIADIAKCQVFTTYTKSNEQIYETGKG